MDKEKSQQLLPPDFNSRTPLEKERYLEANADKVIKDETVLKPLDDDEKEILRFKLEKASIKLADSIKEYDEIKKEWRDKLNDQKFDVQTIVDELRAGFETVTGTVYEIRDYTTMRVHRFTKDGTEFDNRPMLPDERQSTVQSGIRKVTNS